jgi:hypothetical protein
MRIPCLQYILIFLIDIKPIRPPEKGLGNGILLAAVTPIGPIPECIFAYRNIVSTRDETRPYILDDIRFHGVLRLICTYKLTILFYVMRSRYVNEIIKLMTEYLIEWYLIEVVNFELRDDGNTS